MASNVPAPLTAHQVADQLGVKLQTVYAYVSRGLLTRTLSPDGRTSRFDPGEVEQLVRRGRPGGDRRRAGAVDVVLSSALTRLRDGQLLYRGHDVVELVRTGTFESAAELLWAEPGRRPAAGPAAPGGWGSRPAGARAARAVATALGPTAPPAELLAAVAAAVATTEPLRVDLRPAAVTDQARNLLRVFAEVLPRVGPAAPVPPDRRRVVAWHLWPRVSPLRPSRPRVRALDAALVLLADHELASSTLAARVAASTRAAPHAVVIAGLGAASGPLHGKAAVAVQALLDDAADSGDAEAAVARALRPLDAGTGAEGHRRGDRAAAGLPGFGHLVYRGPDPRATCLLDLLDPLLTRRARAAVEGVRAAAARVTPWHPNVDFALGALGHVARMPPGRTEAVFVIARTAGWVAHALEEYGQEPLRFRTRAIYTGL
jgi:citrate synthase